MLKYLQTFPGLCIWKAATTPISTAILSLLWKGYLLTFCRTASNRLRKLWIEISIHSRKESTDTTVCEQCCGRSSKLRNEWNVPLLQGMGEKNITEVEVGFGWNWSKRETHIYVFHMYGNGCLLIKKILEANILIIHCIYLLLMALIIYHLSVPNKKSEEHFHFKPNEKKKKNQRNGTFLWTHIMNFFV